MNGLIDIHTHIIPGVDDGSQTEKMSDEMLNRYAEAGFQTVIATPHMPIVPEADYVSNIFHGFRTITEMSQTHSVEVLRGAEVRLSPEILTDNTYVPDFGLVGTRYVLVDFPSGAWPHYAEDTMFSIQALGLTPILAHPERYGWGSSHRNTARELVDRGVLIQVTLGSLIGTFGSNAKSVSRDLLKSGLVHFTATDAHSAGTRMTAGIEGLHWLRKTHGDRSVDVTLIQNPTAILTDDEIAPYVSEAGRKLWSGLSLSRLVPFS